MTDITSSEQKDEMSLKKSQIQTIQTCVENCPKKTQTIAFTLFTLLHE